ncbi:NLI interacting factor-like phosphatase [Ceratobasidium sp. AG-Ba]|nr:NLI interacting factor-like phosphatase [Ceratobasidium sp. AG-Ba]
MATTSSTVRKSHRRRKPTAPVFVPSRPSNEYLALSQIASNHLTTPRDGAPLPRKLLVLDLNGTLVLRAPRTWGNRPVMNRPFAKTFRDYLFHQGSHLDVMVWSSAQPHSVDSMVDVFFGSDRSRLVGLWARDTLGLTEEQYTQKVQTVKDLNIVWDAPAGLPPPIKIAPPPPMVVLTDDPTSIPGYDPSKVPPPTRIKMHNSNQLMESLIKTEPLAEENQDRTSYWALPEVRPEDPIPGLAGDGEKPAVVQESSGLYSALNTLLLDDSPLKAHLQPYNNLTLPEYTTDLRIRDVKRRDALEELTKGQADNGGPEGEKMDKAAGERHSPESKRGKAHYFKIMRAAPFDKTLIAVIGVLHAARHESSIVGWMRAGGMRPDAQEVARVAGLFEDEQKGHDFPDETDDGFGEDSEERSPLKRSSSDMGDSELGSPKRQRSKPDPIAVAEESDEHARGINVAEDMQVDIPAGVAPRPSLGPTGPALDTVAPHISSSATSPETIPSAEISVTVLSSPQGTTTQSRRNKRRRLKTFYPATHPLSAEDSYPFFTGGNPNEKLWFQDREIYTYWVRRGLLALKDCGIEPEHGVEGS